MVFMTHLIAPRYTYTYIYYSYSGSLVWFELVVLLDKTIMCGGLAEYFGYSGDVCDECGIGKGRDDLGRCSECSEPQINNVTTKTAPCADQGCPLGHGVTSN